MSSDSDWDSHSMDSRPSDFNDGAEAILMNTSFKIEALEGGEGDNLSRCSTPESHKDCHGYNSNGQGAPVYSCGCYKYSEMERYKNPPSHPDLEQALESGNDDPDNIDVLSPKRKTCNEDDTPRNFFQDITNMRAASMPAIELPPLKRRKLESQSKLFEGGLTQSLAQVAQEVAVVREALGRIKEDLGRQSIILLAICEAIQIDEM
ncbi:hypothetical protein DEU56DRAFT_913226 [Suillus clintonianus]|uniref:uncharacterized protein n=1 Tax=Suillus clintonianus TaxID=1904413 RepID=UPI001B884778|nr:uncharacterized protein DEU56DRAFT_913226 [Suillus clintonianus]KAG2135841.1 hypothetical protein DEU56DRAFT_913226 [Suillus clintonianus]